MACKGTPECGSGNVCGRSYSSSQPTKFYDQCFKSCKKDSNCPANSDGTNVCVIIADHELDAFVWGCVYYGNKIGQALPGGGFWRGFGETMAANDGCYSGVKSINNKCTRACENSSDCAAPLPNCGDITVPKPNGIGTTKIKACFLQITF